MRGFHSAIWRLFLERRLVGHMRAITALNLTILVEKWGSDSFPELFSFPSFPIFFS